MNKGLLFTFVMMVATACGGSNPALTADGNPSPTPVDMKIQSGTLCVKTDSGSGTAVTYTYENDLLDSGDVFVSCVVSGQATQSSFSRLYKSGTTTNGPCRVVYDIDAASGGLWAFQKVSGINYVAYIDSASAHNNYQYQFSTSDCSNY
jgi:hypothetical protein